MRVLNIASLILLQCCFIEIANGGRFVAQLQFILFSYIRTNNIETNLTLLITTLAQIAIIISIIKNTRTTNILACISMIILTLIIIITTILASDYIPRVINSVYIIFAAIYFLIFTKKITTPSPLQGSEGQTFPLGGQGTK